VKQKGKSTGFGTGGLGAWKRQAEVMAPLKAEVHEPSDLPGIMITSRIPDME